MVLHDLGGDHDLRGRSSRLSYLSEKMSRLSLSRSRAGHTRLAAIGPGVGFGPGRFALTAIGGVIAGDEAIAACTLECPQMTPQCRQVVHPNDPRNPPRKPFTGPDPAKPPTRENRLPGPTPRSLPTSQLDLNQA